MNGIDEETTPLPEPRGTPGPQLTLLHTGMLYDGKRDPSILFEAIRRLDARRDRVRVRYYGPKLDRVRSLAGQYGVAACVDVHAPVPRDTALRLQREHDILVLLLWNNPAEEGNYPGKLFEYLGARRPILILGAENNVSCRLVREREAGRVLNDPAALSRQLSEWLDRKERGELLPPLEPGRLEGLSRDTQLTHLENILARWVAVR